MASWPITASPSWGKYCDSLITIPNQKLLTVLGPQTTLLDAFKSANQVLQGAVQGIAELITRPGLINVDFADVRTVMAETGMAMMGSGTASGEFRAREAAEAAVFVTSFGGYQPGRGPWHSRQCHGGYGPVPLANSRRSVRSSSSSRPRTRRWWSERSSIPSCRMWFGSRSSRPVWAVPLPSRGRCQRSTARRLRHVSPCIGIP